MATILQLMLLLISLMLLHMGSGAIALTLISVATAAWNPRSWKPLRSYTTQTPTHL